MEVALYEIHDFKHFAWRPTGNIVCLPLEMFRLFKLLDCLHDAYSVELSGRGRSVCVAFATEIDPEMGGRKRVHGESKIHKAKRLCLNF